MSAITPEPRAQQMQRDLLNEAIKARSNSYSPYSKFSVGAAILTESGQIFTGANVENASYGLTICAERSAAVKAVNAGHFKFKAVACVGKRSENEMTYCSPCGACRQFLFEFDNKTEIIGLDPSQDLIVTDLLTELLPKAFGPSNL